MGILKTISWFGVNQHKCLRFLVQPTHGIRISGVKAPNFDCENVIHNFHLMHPGYTKVLKQCSLLASSVLLLLFYFNSHIAVKAREL